MAENDIIKNKVCLNCGNKIISKYGNKFCSSSCATSFNNRKRSKDIYEKIGSKLKKEKNIREDKQKEKKYSHCLYCGKIIKNNKKYCSSECSSKHKHKLSYEDFLKNNEKYCRGNYTPKAFKKEFMAEQDYKCAICNSIPVWNNKELIFILDHIDGDASNNKRSNLRMICPNCDSQLETFKSKNKNSRRRNYWKEKIIKDLTKKGNVQQLYF